MATAPEPDLRISHLAIDRTHAVSGDQGTYFPLRALKTLEAAGEIGELAPRFHGLPTNRSQRITRQVDCAELVERCLADGLDAVVLVPNCPVCHQSTSLAARALESAGLSTVITGCARDIVEHVGVARFLFSDLPLGHAAGLPNDPESQILVARRALQLLETATAPRTTEVSPLGWPAGEAWKRDYANASLLSARELAARRLAFDAAKAATPRMPRRR